MSSSVLPVGAGEAAAAVVAGVMTAGRRDGGAGDAVGSTGSVGGEADFRLDVVAVAAVWSVKTGGGGVVVTSSDVITASTSSMVGTTQSSTVRYRLVQLVTNSKPREKWQVLTKCPVEILKRNIYSTN